MDGVTQATDIKMLQLTKPQRLAAFLLIIGPEVASLILDRLPAKEVEIITREMLRLPTIKPEQQKEIVEEFASLIIEAVSWVSGNISQVKVFFERALGKERAALLLTKLLPGSVSTPEWDQIRNLDIQILVNILRREPPQTIAVVISQLSQEKAAAVLRGLPEPDRVKVVERIAQVQSLPNEAVIALGKKLIERVSRLFIPGQTTSLGGVRLAADLLNSVGREVGQSILNALAQNNPTLAESVRSQMFTFDDLILLDEATLQRIMREVELRDLAIALKDASEQLKQKLLTCISKRAAESVLEEMNFLGKVKPKEIQAARSRIIDVVRRLEAEGEIDLTDILQGEGYETVSLQH